MSMTKAVELSVGTIEYLEVGEGPTVVFSHGPPMTHTLWRKVVPLMEGYRCILPTLPLGGHRRPMNPDADLSQRGQARLLGEFCAALHLEHVTLVLNDWGGGQFLLLEPEGCRVTRLVLVACEAFDNFPPPPARLMAALTRVPGGAWLFSRLMQIGPFRRARFSYGAMTVHPVEDGIMRDWFAPMARNRLIRRDFAKFAPSAPDKATLLSWSEQLRAYPHPVLVVWADQDRMMPPEHGRRLVELYPDARLVEITDTGTLVPEDQPVVLAETLRIFLAETTPYPRDA